MLKIFLIIFFIIINDFLFSYNFLTNQAVNLNVNKKNLISNISAKPLLNKTIISKQTTSNYDFSSKKYLFKFK